MGENRVRYVKAYAMESDTYDFIFSSFLFNFYFSLFHKVVSLSNKGEFKN